MASHKHHNHGSSEIPAKVSTAAALRQDLQRLGLALFITIIFTAALVIVQQRTGVITKFITLPDTAVTSEPSAEVEPPLLVTPKAAATAPSE